MNLIFQSAVSFFKYCGVSVLVAAVDWFVFFLLLSNGVPSTISQPCSRISGGLTSFLVNGFWSFRLNKKPPMELQGARFIILYISSFILAYVIYVGSLSFTALGPVISKFVADLVCFCVNFLVMHNWVFRVRN